MNSHFCMHSYNVIVKHLFTLTCQAFSSQNILTFKLNKFNETWIHGSPCEMEFKEWTNPSRKNITVFPF